MDSPSNADSQSHYPDLPNIPCPRNLFISLLSNKYLTALYLVEPSIFPQNWKMLVKITPVEAWKVLNQGIIHYLNLRYNSQGLYLGRNESEVLSLAQKISENVCKDLQNEDVTSNDFPKKASLIPKNGEFDLLVEKLQIVLDIVSTQIAKFTGREVTIHVTTDSKTIHKKKCSKEELFHK